MFESALVACLQRLGHPYAERRALAGSADRGDVTGLGPRYVIEAKAAKRFEIGPWLKETATERENAKADYGFLVLKLPRKSIEDCAVLMTVRELAAIITELESK
jgi:hypothetical protein